MNAPLRFSCPEDDCEGSEWTAHGMQYIGGVVQVRELRCIECGTPVKQGDPMLATAETVATDGGGDRRHPEAPETAEADCPNCGEESATWDHAGEEPVNSTSGAWGKYVAAIYEARCCGYRTEGHPVSGRWSA